MKGGRVARVISGIAHAAVLGLLGVPFVGFWAGCTSPLGGSVSGYQALDGFTLPHDDVEALDMAGVPLSSIPAFGPNLWIGLLIIVAVIGVAAAVIGGPGATASRIASAGVGIFAAWAAIALFYPTTFDVDGVTVTTNSDPGGQQAVVTVLLIALVADCWSLARWWSRRPLAAASTNGPPAPKASQEAQALKR